MNKVLQLKCMIPQHETWEYDQNQLLEHELNYNFGKKCFLLNVSGFSSCVRLPDYDYKNLIGLVVVYEFRT